METKQNYRDILVEQIKSAGQELIDRADSMVAEDLDAIIGFSIQILFSKDRVPGLSFTTETIVKNTVKRTGVAEYLREKGVQL